MGDYLTKIADINQLGEALFEKRMPLMGLWQDIAENFYPERADFTVQRALGANFAEHLDTSFPMIVRRDLANSFGSMLRPAGQPWFELSVEDEERLDKDSRVWLERATGVQRRAMYDVDSRFTRATKEGDHEFATFGQAVISVEKAFSKQNGPHLLYRCWHLRDVVWMENDTGAIDTVFRRWKPTPRSMLRKFPKTGSEKLREMVKNDPLGEINVRHYVTAAENYDGPEAESHPWVSIYYEVDSGQVLECVGIDHNPYVIPRWQTVSGSQYAFSPATVVALPDARLLQAMIGTLLTAGEKFVDPPMIAVKEALRSDIAIYPGGITWVDSEYDERLGEVLRPLTQDKGGIPLGIEMAREVRAMLMEAFFLNKIELPPPDHEMTAYEAGQRVAQYLRYALPLFEPMESDYNGQLCERSADVLMANAAFGPLDLVPRRLSGQKLRFKFQTPLQAAMDSKKGAILGQAKALLAQVMDIDPLATQILDARTALRDALHGIQVPSKWTRDEKEVQAIADAASQQQANAQLLDRAAQASEVAVNVTKAQQQSGAAALVQA